MNWFGAIARAVAPVFSESSAQPLAIIGPNANTVGDIKQVAGILMDPSLGVALKGVVDSEFADWPDAMQIGEDSLAVLAIVFPASAPLIALATLALELAPLVMANGRIKPDADPVSDAQTSESRGGRQG